MARAWKGTTLNPIRVAPFSTETSVPRAIGWVHINRHWLSTTTVKIRTWQRTINTPGTTWVAFRIRQLIHSRLGWMMETNLESRALGALERIHLPSRKDISLAVKRLMQVLLKLNLELQNNLDLSRIKKWWCLKHHREDSRCSTRMSLRFTRRKRCQPWSAQASKVETWAWSASVEANRCTALMTTCKKCIIHHRFMRITITIITA